MYIYIYIRYTNAVCTLIIRNNIANMAYANVGIVSSNINSKRGDNFGDR